MVKNPPAQARDTGSIKKEVKKNGLNPLKKKIRVFFFLNVSFIQFPNYFQGLARYYRLTDLNSLAIQATVYRSRSHFDKGWRRKFQRTGLIHS